MMDLMSVFAASGSLKPEVKEILPSPCPPILYGVHTSLKPSQVNANSPPSPQFWGDKKI